MFYCSTSDHVLLFVLVIKQLKTARGQLMPPPHNLLVAGA